MTFKEAIKAGNHEEIKRISDAMDKIRRRDIDQKVMVINAFIICKGIAIIGVALLILMKY